MTASLEYHNDVSFNPINLIQFLPYSSTSKSFQDSILSLAFASLIILLLKAQNYCPPFHIVHCPKSQPHLRNFKRAMWSVLIFNRSCQMHLTDVRSSTMPSYFAWKDCYTIHRETLRRGLTNKKRNRKKIQCFLHVWSSFWRLDATYEVVQTTENACTNARHK